MIEFLSKINENNFAIFTEKEFSNYSISKPAIIKFNNNNENKNINITISSKTGKAFGYWSLSGYSIDNYINYI